ncbi:hypothetical protein BpHYR1_033517 [Brachionus plicatilis]|uniref:Uncharacterized protein n=1 Tax=Brachionus plicatilis TaxID=10195 RepID=A0A3M7PDH3_BRAPC|nr:hypothetical protein BpHYR1_033517 [Brachionus plicatilis]
MSKIRFLLQIIQMLILICEKKNKKKKNFILMRDIFSSLYSFFLSLNKKLLKPKVSFELNDPEKELFSECDGNKDEEAQK